MQNGGHQGAGRIYSTRRRRDPGTAEAGKVLVRWNAIGMRRRVRTPVGRAWAGQQRSGLASRAGAWYQGRMRQHGGAATGSGAPYPCVTNNGRHACSGEKKKRWRSS